jgi:CheY-like chemotaxis protein/HPt (histidine-containing phosphotransfer) domain-containing protein
MMTSLGRQEEAARLKEIGFNGYLTKPVKKSQLYDSLIELVEEKGVESAIKKPVEQRPVPQVEGEGRILVAEDNAVNQKVALRILEKMGYRADAVANGLEAIDVLAEIPYDLVLMDVQMPEMDGYNAARIIRDPSSQVRDHDVPVVAMTAHAMKGDREKCLEAGMDDYVPKPVQPQELARVIEEWLATEKTPEPQPEAAAQDDGKVFDRPNLVERLDGDEEIIGEVIGIFLEDAPRRLQVLEDALQESDAALAQREAHTLKGAASNLSAPSLQEAARRVEQAAEAGDLSDATDHLAPLREAFEELKPVLEEQLR